MERYKKGGFFSFSREPFHPHSLNSNAALDIGFTESHLTAWSAFGKGRISII